MILRFFGQLSANVVQTFSISDHANSSPYCQDKKIANNYSLGQVSKDSQFYSIKKKQNKKNPALSP